MIFFYKVAYVDFNTIAMIACCVAKHNLCGTCGGASLSHDKHDKIFGGKKVYLVCLLIWVVSFLTILPDVMGVGIDNILSICKIFVSRLQVPILGQIHHMVVTLCVPRRDVRILALSSPALTIWYSWLSSILSSLLIFIWRGGRQEKYLFDKYFNSTFSLMERTYRITWKCSSLYQQLWQFLYQPTSYLVCLLSVKATWVYWPAKTENSSYKTKAVFASMYCLWCLSIGH